MGEGSELFGVVLLDRSAFAVEALDIIEPCYAVGYPGVGRFEAILCARVRLVNASSHFIPFSLSVPYLQFRAEGRRNIHLGHCPWRGVVREEQLSCEPGPEASYEVYNLSVL